MKAASELFDVTYEDDVNLLQRFIIDNKIKFSKNKRIVYFDIETDASIDVTADKPIISISAFDNFTQMYTTWAWRSVQ